MTVKGCLTINSINTIRIFYLVQVGGISYLQHPKFSDGLNSWVNSFNAQRQCNVGLEN